MAGDVLLIGTRKGLLVGRRNGAAGWNIGDLSFPMSGVYTVGYDQRGDTPRLFAGAHSEHWGPSLFHSDDLGRTWTEPEQAPIAFPEGTDAALARVWQIVPANPDQPGVVYAGVEPSALFRSTDGGLTFELVRGLWDHPHRSSWFPGAGGQAIHTIIPHPTDDDRIMVAMSTGGVYQSSDGGATWHPTNTGVEAGFNPADPFPEFGQCVHRVARSATQPDRLYLQNHGGVYRSDDGGSTWQSIDAGLPANFGFSVVVHPTDPDTAYVFPLTADWERLPPRHRCAVYRTSDAGQTWQELTNGLPDGPFLSSVLRDAMTITESGELYFGTRNGEVYESRDEGESWQEVAARLPDVLSVRKLSA
jgi:photosystem II stability/assembly factor-like uncharacterized protein